MNTDARTKCIVDAGEKIGGEEDYAAEVFELAEEDFGDD